MAKAGEETQISCRFITKLPDVYRVPPSTVAVPSQLHRYGLSQIINHLLALEPQRPFDFLLDGELVRESLEGFLLSHGISAEKVLEIEYIFSVEPAKPEQQHRHNDWVSAVAARSACILSGSYDGTVKTWRGAQLTSTVALHRGPVTAAAALPEAQGPLALTGGQDATVLLSSVPALAAEPDNAGAAEAQPLVAYREHTDAVTGIAVSPEGALLVSASWDTSLRIWPTGSAVAERAREEDAATAKHETGAKRKKGAAGAAMPSAPSVEASKQELSGHSQAVSSVAWPSPETILSGSWDNSVRRWDAEICTCTERHDGSKAVYCIAAAPAGSQLVAFGGAEHALHIWDPRTPVSKETDQKLYSSHTHWISSVAWHPVSEHHVVSASYDNSLKLWDIRAAIPLHTLQGHSEKVLCVAWSGLDSFVSGGADCLLRSYTVSV
ncbi:hypothetical protein CVIRNUC_000750 [Coccomyxa viridis]|uniref:Ribosome biogenesis protein WDR12 homolog n=1 Tax=Coccomyxa viridis TaxID=1274662 RepID=A0AAV1HVP1_9CHLO|nr:hypothetical protein CVIRNUC_000750 [Coccomyxa viridis]